MNKQETRKADLERHYKALENLALLCDVKNPNGKKLSLKLWEIEKQTYKPILDWTNGDLIISYEALDNITDIAVKKIQKLFNNNLKGLKINRDPRGYCLKINDEVMRNEYFNTGLQRDWGGYGILAPDFNN